VAGELPTLFHRQRSDEHLRMTSHDHLPHRYVEGSLTESRPGSNYPVNVPRRATSPA
jgi:hypothetical protein